jgi:hypothetical protein
LQFGKLQ